jgi:hypothetical protein
MHLESKKSNIPERELKTEGKYKCPADNPEYDTKEDYDAHCMEEYPDGM